MRTTRVRENGDLNNPNVNMNRATTFIIWNIRGENNDEFRLNFRDMVNTHRPSMVTLLETKMDNHLPLLNPFGFFDMIEIHVEGQAGGMLILWDHTVVNVHSFVRRSQEINATIEVISTHKSWLFTSIYDSTDKNLRNKMWSNLIDMHTVHKGPWLVGGDFNDVLGVNKKICGNCINSNRARLLWDCINSCNLIDIGFKGCKYTWYNHRRKNNGLIMERLDKVFANEEWITLFPNAIVTHLPKTHSNHNPIKLELLLKYNYNLSRPFRLETFWTGHPEFASIVKK